MYSKQLTYLKKKSKQFTDTNLNAVLAVEWRHVHAHIAHYGC
jgi:ligand-binding SRPBCC domain-containing protein